MGATYTKRGAGSWLVTVHYRGERERITVHSKGDAEALVQSVHKHELAGINVIETMRQARQAHAAPRAIVPTPTLPVLRDAVPAWLEAQERAGEIRTSSGHQYRARLAKWAYPFTLADGRALGDVPINEVTREMLGAAIRHIRESGRSLSIIAGVRNPLRSFYAAQIEMRVLPGPNPAGDLKFYVGRAHKRSRVTADKFFAQEEGPALLATAKAAYPRFYAFILTGVLAGLRWGEAAALRKSDVDFARGRLYVARTVSDRNRKIERCKDHDARWVKASPALLAALRSQIETVGLEATVKDWTPEQRELVFPNTVGRLMQYTTFLTKCWSPLLDKAGLVYRSPHAMRHTFATWLLSDGADLKWVSQQLGHASISITVDTYGHCQPERHEAATAGLDKYVL